MGETSADWTRSRSPLSSVLHRCIAPSHPSPPAPPLLPLCFARPHHHTPHLISRSRTAHPATLTRIVQPAGAKPTRHSSRPLFLLNPPHRTCTVHCSAPPMPSRSVACAASLPPQRLTLCCCGCAVVVSAVDCSACDCFPSPSSLAMPLNVSDAEKQELLVTYAALILNDEKLTVSAENIQKLISAAGGTVEPYWPKLFGQPRYTPQTPLLSLPSHPHPFPAS